MLVLLHLFALFLLVLLGFYVFVADPRSRANQTFATFIAFLALWTTKDLIFWNFHDAGIRAGWWVASSFTIALLMQCALVVFAWVFPENNRTPKKRAAILFAPGVVLIAAGMLGFLWHQASFENERFVIDLAPLAYVFVTYVYFLFFYGAVILYGKYRKHKGTQRGQQVGAILWALVVTGVLKTVANIALPFFGIYELLPFSSIFVLPGVLIYAYAISNFRLFSLQTALDQFRLFPLTYKIALSIASVALASFDIPTSNCVVGVPGWRDCGRMAEISRLQRGLRTCSESLASVACCSNYLPAFAAIDGRSRPGNGGRLWNRGRSPEKQR